MRIEVAHIHRTRALKRRRNTENTAAATDVYDALSRGESKVQTHSGGLVLSRAERHSGVESHNPFPGLGIVFYPRGNDGYVLGHNGLVIFFPFVRPVSVVEGNHVDFAETHSRVFHIVESCAKRGHEFRVAFGHHGGHPDVASRRKDFLVDIVPDYVRFQQGGEVLPVEDFHAFRACVKHRRRYYFGVFVVGDYGDFFEFHTQNKRFTPLKRERKPPVQFLSLYSFLRGNCLRSKSASSFLSKSFCSLVRLLGTSTMTLT